MALTVFSVAFLTGTAQVQATQDPDNLPPPPPPSADENPQMFGDVEVTIEGETGTEADGNTAQQTTNVNSAPPLCIDRPVSEMEASARPDGTVGGAVAAAGSHMVVGGLQHIDETQRPEPEAYLVTVVCRDPDIDCAPPAECVYDQPGGDGPQWRYPGDSPATTEADLIATIRAELEDELPQPIVGTNPRDDRASIVNVPTFVYVENWTGTYEPDEACAPENPDFCISAVAEPRMTFDPGDGTTPIDNCGQDGGQPYDRNLWNDDPFYQADLPQTCTHTYTSPTRDGATYPAQVTVTWDITWTPPEADGTPTVSLTTDIPREVNEVRTTITD